MLDACLCSVSVCVRVAATAAWVRRALSLHMTLKSVMSEAMPPWLHKLQALGVTGSAQHVSFV